MRKRDGDFPLPVQTNDEKDSSLIQLVKHTQLANTTPIYRWQE